MHPRKYILCIPCIYAFSTKTQSYTYVYVWTKIIIVAIHTYNIWEDEKCKYFVQEGKFIRALTIWFMYAYDSTVDF